MTESTHPFPVTEEHARLARELVSIPGTWGLLDGCPVAYAHEGGALAAIGYVWVAPDGASAGRIGGLPGAGRCGTKAPAPFCSNEIPDVRSPLALGAIWFGIVRRVWPKARSRVIRHHGGRGISVPSSVGEFMGAVFPEDPDELAAILKAAIGAREKMVAEAMAAATRESMLAQKPLGSKAQAVLDAINDFRSELDEDDPAQAVIYDRIVQARAAVRTLLPVPRPPRS